MPLDGGEGHLATTMQACLRTCSSLIVGVAACTLARSVLTSLPLRARLFSTVAFLNIAVLTDDAVRVRRINSRQYSSQFDARLNCQLSSPRFDGGVAKTFDRGLDWGNRNKSI